MSHLLSRIHEVIAGYLEDCRVRRGLSDSTLLAYRSDLRDFAAYLHREVIVGRTTEQVVRDYASHLLVDRGLKASTVKRRMATVTGIFSCAEANGILEHGAVKAISFPIRLPRRLPRTLEPGEMSALINRSWREGSGDTNRRDYHALMMQFVVLALFTTGIRVTELTSAAISDVGLADSSFRVKGKGNRERLVYITGELANQTLRSYLERRRDYATDDQLLCRLNGKRISSQYVRRSLRALARRAGITKPVTPHMLRHTAATQLLEAGVDIRFVQRLLGHASILTTQIYADVRDDSLRKVVSSADTVSRLSPVLI